MVRKNILMPLISSSAAPLTTRPFAIPDPSLVEFGNTLRHGGRFRPRALNSSVDDALLYWREHKIDGVVATFTVSCDFNVIHHLVRSIRQNQAVWNAANGAADPSVPLVVVAEGVPEEVFTVGVGEPDSVVVHVVNSLESAGEVLNQLFG